MGWTLQYKATAHEEVLETFVNEANQHSLKLSWGAEPYCWGLNEDNTAGGFTKIESSFRKKKDFIKIINELKRLSEKWPNVRISVVDDYVLEDWWQVKNIEVDKLDL
ncbi:hypothetical protein [Marinicella litoralis]|uniref:Uncharacterized protein n=1 Tax=Marinicella litoralis TaxID=644220 RepID=A0A4R6XU54_9GAMM|nr:hypothetical protein [Marinicella litoralis]TDR23512.1 hypothetical protein C8D91_0374 [Marinicella litoralis]